MSRLSALINHGPYAQGAEWLGTLGRDGEILRCPDCGTVWGVRGRTNMEQGYIVFRSRPLGNLPPCDSTPTP